jgi:DNA-directed RNA polymerase specialized sigma subunit
MLEDVDMEALKLLTRRQREAMMARLAADGVVPQKQIAIQLNVTQSAVSQRLWGGIKRLREKAIDVGPLMRRLALT